MAASARRAATPAIKRATNGNQEKSKKRSSRGNEEVRKRATGHHLLDDERQAAAEASGERLVTSKGVLRAITTAITCDEEVVTSNQKPMRCRRELNTCVRRLSVAT